MYQTERRIAVEWGGGVRRLSRATLDSCKGSRGLTRGNHRRHQRRRLNIHNLESRPDRNNARIDANLEIADKRQLETIVANIRKISGRLRRGTRVSASG